MKHWSFECLHRFSWIQKVLKVSSIEDKNFKSLFNLWISIIIVILNQSHVFPIFGYLDLEDYFQTRNENEEKEIQKFNESHRLLICLRIILNVLYGDIQNCNENVKQEYINFINYYDVIHSTNIFKLYKKCSFFICL